MKPISLTANSISTPLQLLVEELFEIGGIEKRIGYQQSQSSFWYNTKVNGVKGKCNSYVPLSYSYTEIFFRRFFDQISPFFHFILFYFITGHNASRHEI